MRFKTYKEKVIYRTDLSQCKSVGYITGNVVIVEFARMNYASL